MPIPKRKHLAGYYSIKTNDFMKGKANAHWQGDIKEGNESLSSQSMLPNTPHILTNPDLKSNRLPILENYWQRLMLDVLE
jgi:hypothetical protein